MRGEDVSDVDRGWAWVVMAASFLNLTSITVLVYSIGMQQVILLEVFDRGFASTTWILAITIGLMSLTGPLSGLLSSLTSSRTTMLIGCCLQTVGLTASAFVTKLNHLYITLSIITGVGGGLSYSSSMVVLGFYFDRYLNLATCVAVAGGGVGMMLSAPFANYMAESFGWRGMFLMLAGVCANCFVWSALSRPNSVEIRLTSRKRRPQIGAKEIQHTSDSTEAMSIDEDCMRFKMASRGHGDHITGIDHRTPDDDRPLRKQEHHIENRNTNELRHISIDEIDFHGNLSRGLGIRRSMRIVCSVPMLLYSISTFTSGLGISAVLQHLPNYLVVNGLTKVQSALLLTPMGVCNFISRLSTGCLLNSGLIDPVVLLSACHALMGIITLGFPFLYVTFPVSMVFSGLFGLCFGGPTAMLSTITKDLVGVSHLAIAFGLTMLMSGAGYMLGPPIAGLLFEISGVYKWTFVFAGIVSFCTSILALVLACYRKSNVQMEVPIKNDVV